MAPEGENRAVDLEDLLVRPGTYFNPQTEVVVVVDDSVSIDQDIFDLEAYEGADWVRVSDEVPVDSDALETTMERFQTVHAGSGARVSETTLEQDEDDYETTEQDLEPDPDPGE